MINFPPNSILVAKINGAGNDFFEKSLDCNDINAVSVTGIQTISGQKSFEQSIICSGLTNYPSQSLNFTTNGVETLSLSPVGELSLQSASTYSGSGITTVTASIQTTANGLVTLYSLPIADNSAYWLDVYTIGRSVGGTLRIRMENNRACIYRDSGGLATIVGAIDNTLSRSLSAGGYDVSLAVDSNNFLVRVDGATAETVNWTTTIHYQKITN